MDNAIANTPTSVSLRYAPGDFAQKRSGANCSQPPTNETLQAPNEIKACPECERRKENQERALMRSLRTILAQSTSDQAAAAGDDDNVA